MQSTNDDERLPVDFKDRRWRVFYRYATDCSLSLQRLGSVANRFFLSIDDGRASTPIFLFTLTHTHTQPFYYDPSLLSGLRTRTTTQIHQQLSDQLRSLRTASASRTLSISRAIKAAFPPKLFLFNVDTA